MTDSPDTPQLHRLRQLVGHEREILGRRVRPINNCRNFVSKSSQAAARTFPYVFPEFGSQTDFF